MGSYEYIPIVSSGREREPFQFRELWILHLYRYTVPELLARVYSDQLICLVQN